MSTLREWLNEEGFDWENGVIVYQPVRPYGDGVEGSPCPGWGDSADGYYIDSNHAILDVEFSSGYGGPECPRIFARDGEAIYFPGQYDGATWLEKVVIDPERYIGEGRIETPYPGG